MRKISVALTLIFFGLALAALPAQATSSDEEAFIASLVTSEPVLDPAASPVASKGRNDEADPFTEGGCSATATCYTGSTVSCSISYAGTCTSVDAACNTYGGQRGYVKCGSQATIYCPTCPGSGGGCGYCSSNSYCNACCPTGYGTCSSGNCTCMF